MTDPQTIAVNGQTYFYHNDHLGTPQTVTDAAGNVVWAAEMAAFGGMSVTTQTIVSNLRFPGQYWDQESGLAYNWHRYYDAGVGRYVQSDPIGLAGGVNRWGYVENEPVALIDPWGLMGAAPGGVVKGGMPGVSVGVKGCIGLMCGSWQQGDTDTQLSMELALGGAITFCDDPNDDISWKKKLFPPPKPKPVNECTAVNPSGKPTFPPKKCTNPYDPACNNQLQAPGVGSAPRLRYGGVVVTLSVKADGAICLEIGPIAGIPFMPSLDIGGLHHD